MALFHLNFIDDSTEIEAPTSDVFHRIKDLDQWSNWASGIRQAHAAPGSAWGVGLQISFTPSFMRMPVKTKIVAYQENRLIEWGFRSPVATLIHRFEFEPVGETRCRVRQFEYAEGILGILTRPLRRTFETFDKCLSDDLKASFA